MAQTKVNSAMILDGDVKRADLNTSTSGSAVITKVIAGTGVTTSSTGADTGTGDVTINALAYYTWTFVVSGSTTNMVVNHAYVHDDTVLGNFNTPDTPNVGDRVFLVGGEHVGLWKLSPLASIFGSNIYCEDNSFVSDGTSTYLKATIPGDFVELVCIANSSTFDWRVIRCSPGVKTDAGVYVGKTYQGSIEQNGATTNQVLIWNGSAWAPGTTTSATWTDTVVTGTSVTNLVVDSCTIFTNASLSTGPLPTTAAVGKVFRIISNGAAGVDITQNSGQTIKAENNSTTGTGKIHLAQFAVVDLKCITANTDFEIVNAQGTVTTDTGAAVRVRSVTMGGTGASTLTAHGVLIGNGTAAVSTTSAGTKGYALLSNGASADPTFQGPVTSQSTPSAPTGTTSLTGVMMGMAGTITPTGSGTIVILISGDISNTTTSGGKVQIRYGTGSAPANAAALTGTAVGGLVQLTKSVSDTIKAPFSLNAIVTGLTAGTAVWIDVGLAAISAGTASIGDVSITAFEL